MAVKDTNRERTRTQLMDAISALGGAIKSIESVREHILEPIGQNSRRYNYPEAVDVEDSIQDLKIGVRNVQEGIQNLRRAVVEIAREG